MPKDNFRRKEKRPKKSKGVSKVSRKTTSIKSSKAKLPKSSTGTSSTSKVRIRDTENYESQQKDIKRYEKKVKALEKKAKRKTRSEAMREVWRRKKESPEYWTEEAIADRKEWAKKMLEARRLKKEKEDLEAEVTPNNIDRQGTAVTPKHIDRTESVIENFKRSVAFATLEDVENTLKNYDKTSVPVSKTVQDLKGDDRNIILASLEAAISAQGREQVAMNIEQSNMTDLLNDILYASGSKSNTIGREGFQAKVDQISRILFGRAITLDESIYITYRSEQLNEGE